MPKVKAPPPAKAGPSKVDFAQRGMALALSDLADERGMYVYDVAKFAHILRAAGLPDKLPHAVVMEAGRLARDRLDAILWRCKWYPNKPPELTWEQARGKETAAEERQAAKALADRQARSTLNRRETKAIASKLSGSAVELDGAGITGDEL